MYRVPSTVTIDYAPAGSSGSKHYQSRFTEGKLRLRRNGKTCPRAYIWQMIELNSNPALLVLESELFPLWHTASSPLRYRAMLELEKFTLRLFVEVIYKSSTQLETYGRLPNLALVLALSAILIHVFPNESNICNSLRPPSRKYTSVLLNVYWLWVNAL